MVKGEHGLSVTWTLAMKKSTCSENKHVAAGFAAVQAAAFASYSTSNAVNLLQVIGGKNQN